MIKRYLAEFIGTFCIVFAPIALGATSKLASIESGLLVAALASGLPVLAMIYALGPISAAHFNPAVTIAFAACKRFPWKYVSPYIVSQVLGGIAAGGLSALLYGPGGGVHLPLDHTQILRNVGTEMVISFFLMFVIMGVATDKRTTGAVPAIAIGFTVVFCILVAGPITGGSMNPARSIGAGAFGGPGAISELWLYVLAPILGTCLAALTYESVRLATEEAQSVPDLK